MPNPKTMGTRYQGGFSVKWVPKLLISQVKIRIFAQKQPNVARNWHFWSFGPGLAGSFGALLVGWMVVVARGLYLARHLFTLFDNCTSYDFLHIGRYLLPRPESVGQLRLERFCKSCNKIQVDPRVDVFPDLKEINPYLL